MASVLDDQTDTRVTGEVDCGLDIGDICGIDDVDWVATLGASVGLGEDARWLARHSSVQRREHLDRVFGAARVSATILCNRPYLRSHLLEEWICPAVGHGLTGGVVNENTGAIAVADVSLRQRLEQRSISSRVQSFPVLIGGPLGITREDFAVVFTSESIVRSRYRGASHIDGATLEDARQFGSVQCLVLVREVWNTAIGRLLDGRYIQDTCLARSQVRGVHCRLIEVPRKIPGGDAGREPES
jgi:hypothetical protein